MAYLTYDRSGLTEENIGPRFGVDPEIRDSLTGQLEKAVEALDEAHESGALGFMNTPDTDIDSIQSWAREKRDGDFTDAVVLGIGGSSLGARAILESAPADTLDGLDVHVSENIDPDSIRRRFDALDVSKTLFVVVTKSGTTIETMSQFAIAWDALVDEVGEQEAADHIVAVTDPEEGALRELADRRGFDSFSIPPNVGGRFSVLTPVGLVPLALAGYPIDELLAGARDARDTALVSSIDDNPILEAAADTYLLYEQGISEIVMMAYSDRLDGLVDWFRQLWAESLGKAKNRAGDEVNVGQTPIKALGTVDQHSQVQLYMEGPASRQVIFLKVEQFDNEVTIPEEGGLPDALSHIGGRSLAEVFNAELDGTEHALRENGRPTSRWTFERIDPRAVGGFIIAWEFITAVMGELLDIDAFNQPGVELGKKIAHGLLGRPGHEEYAEVVSGADSEQTAGTIVAE